MRRSASESLKGQAEALVAAASAAADWFRRPAASALSAARVARLRALGWRDAAKPADDEVSYALREAVEHAAQSVAEAARWGVEPDLSLFRTAEAVRESAKKLAAAAASKGRARAAALVEAKRWAGEAERLRRLTRAGAHEDPSLTNALKRETVSTRLSNAAEAVQQACDALAGSLIE